MLNIHYPKVSIIILNWNGLKDTIECLESLKKISYPSYEVIVVDNASQGNDTDILEEKYKNRIKLIKNKENLGFTGGNNVGIRQAIEDKSEYVLLLNNDTTVEPDFLEEITKTALRDKKIAIIGSVIVDYYTKKIVFTNSKIDKKLKGEVRLDYLNSNKDWWYTERVNGASMMIKIEAILKYSLFLDENLFLYCDEIDICMRAKKYGLKVVMAGKSRVYHKEGKSPNSDKILNPITVYYILRNRIILAKKLLGPRDQIVFWILFVPARLFPVLEWSMKGEWNLVKATFKAFHDGLEGRSGKKSI